MSGIKIGEMNQLLVVREHALGLFLEGGDAGEVLLPARLVPASCQVGDRLEVFVYQDVDGQLLATTLRPRAQVGEVAWLKVVAVNKVGAFLDWGLPKDLLCPFAEQKVPMEAGRHYLVMVFLDEQLRVAASARIDEFLEDENDGTFVAGQEVNLLIADKTPLGIKAVVNNSHWGVLYENELFAPVRKGQALTGFVKKIRDDGRIDLTLHRPGHTRSRIDQLADTVLERLKAQRGFLPVHDKTPPEDIYAQFGVSKKMFKQAIGLLYKRRLITIGDDGIRSVS